jgi:hypothetical protein
MKKEVDPSRHAGSEPTFALHKGQLCSLSHHVVRQTSQKTCEQLRTTGEWNWSWQIVHIGPAAFNCCALGVLPRTCWKIQNIQG